MSLIGRNDRCLCGSGLKFKKCCLLKDQKGRLDASFEKLKNRATERAKECGDKGSLYFRDFSGVRKMSEIILEFAEPLLNEAETIKMKKSAIALTMVALNMSLIKKFDDDFNKLNSEMSDLSGQQFAIDTASAVSFLIQRKLELYPDVKRFIMDYDFVDTGSGFHLNVVSTPLSEDSEFEGFRNEAQRLLKSKTLLNQQSR